MCNYIDDYDATLAVQAMRTLIYETHDNASRTELVWTPTREFISTLADETDGRVTAFASERFCFPPISTGQCCNLFLINKWLQVCYVGTAFSAEASLLYRQSTIKSYDAINPELAQQMAQASPETFFHDIYFCQIPSTAEVLDENALIECLLQRIRAISPLAAERPIYWLPKTVGHDLAYKIMQAAEATSLPASAEERLRTIFNDLKES